MSKMCLQHCLQKLVRVAFSFLFTLRMGKIAGFLDDKAISNQYAPRQLLFKFLNTKCLSSRTTRADYVFSLPTSAVLAQVAQLEFPLVRTSRPKFFCDCALLPTVCSIILVNLKDDKTFQPDECGFTLVAYLKVQKSTKHFVWQQCLERACAAFKCLTTHCLNERQALSLSGSLRLFSEQCSQAASVCCHQ